MTATTARADTALPERGGALWDGLRDGLSAEGRRQLEHGGVHRTAPAGAVILHKGQPVAGAYVVRRGRLRVYTHTPSGHEATLYFIDPGETCIFALNCLFNDLLYPAWVQTSADTEVTVIPGPLYRHLFEREPSVQSLTVSALSTLVFRLMGELELLHSTHHRERLANFLLVHAAADGQLRMTQQRIAQHLGTTREVVARLLGAFVAQGLVRTSRGCIQIVDVFGLRAQVLPSEARNSS